MNNIMYAKYKQNSTYPIPEDYEIVYRYMPIWKFEDILSKKALYLSSKYKLRDGPSGDSMEATSPISASNYAKERLNKTDLFNKDMINDFAKSNKQFQEESSKRSFSSSWFLGSEESKNMWDKYGDNGQGIVIKTTFLNLRESFYKIQDFEKQPESKESQELFADTVWINKRHYEAYENCQPSEESYNRNKDLFAFLISKDRSYEQESEVMVWLPPDFVSSWSDGSFDGVLVSVKLDILIDELIVTTFDRQEQVKALLKNNGLNDKKVHLSKVFNIN